MNESIVSKASVELSWAIRDRGSPLIIFLQLENQAFEYKPQRSHIHQFLPLVLFDAHIFQLKYLLYPACVIGCIVRSTLDLLA